MKKTYKQIKFVIIGCLKKVAGFILNLFIKRDSLYITFYANLQPNKELFLHNTKYLFLYLKKYYQNEYHLNWLCNDKKMLNYFKSEGIKEIRSPFSIKGAYYALKSKYWFYDFDPTFIKSIWINNAMLLNPWHGIPLKKIAYDNKYEYQAYKKAPQWKRNIEDFFRVKANYYFANSEYDRKCFSTALRTPENKIIITGSPRLDVLFQEFENDNLLMEKDYSNIINFKKNNNKLFLYVPTFRDDGKNITNWLKVPTLNEFLEENNIALICKLHPIDINSINDINSKMIYKMDSSSDLYPILKYTDALITDYSSIYFDYLLLDKPIIYYSFDLNEYQENCHGFYEPYENLTAGVKAYNEQELINAMRDVINGVDNYKDERKALRDRMFKYQDGRNCERVVEFIRSLNK